MVGRLEDGWRTGGMGLRAAVRKWNASDEEKELVHRTVAQRWLHAENFIAYVPLVGGDIQLPNIEQRKVWYGLHHRHKPAWWYSICFSDSTQVQYFHSPIARNERVWARAGEKVRPLRKKRHHRKTLHTYGVLTKWGMVGPFFVSGSVTAHKYITQILPKLLEGITSLFARKGDNSTWIFMQDGAGAHTADRTQRWLANSSYHFWDKSMWPGKSPDLNPIEGMWGILQADVTPVEVEQPLPDEELRSRIVVWFVNGQQATCRKALRGMPDRCEELREADFQAIGH